MEGYSKLEEAEMVTQGRNGNATLRIDFEKGGIHLCKEKLVTSDST